MKNSRHTKFCVSFSILSSLFLFEAVPYDIKQFVLKGLELFFFFETLSYLCITCIYVCAFKDQKRATELLGIGLLTVVRCYVSAEN